MLRSALLRPGAARVIIAAQVLPILMLRPASYSLSTQEWWLPALLALLALIAAVNVLVRGTRAVWPWRLFSFAQGFSIISKLMMFMPHATIIENGVQRVDVAHVVLSLVSMLLSAFIIWYCEQPEVRNMDLGVASASRESN